jgi:hypothetical protein
MLLAWKNAFTIHVSAVRAIQVFNTDLICYMNDSVLA